MTDSLDYDTFPPTNDENSTATLRVLIFIHGGLWVSRDKADYSGFGRYYAAKGYTVVIPNYRLGVRHPGAVNDVAAVVQQVSKQFDQQQLILIGHSCGAHIAAQLWLQAAQFDLQKACLTACVGIEGLYDLCRFADDFAEWESELYVTFTDNRANWVSPQTMKAEACAAVQWLVVHSAEDKYVNEIQSTAWHERLAGMSDSVCVSAEYKLVGGNHFDAVNAVDIEMEKDSPAQQLTNEIDQFLQSIGTTEFSE